MSIIAGKCPNCSTEITLTNENGINCPQCGIKITYDNIIITKKSLSEEVISELTKLQKRADGYFKSEEYETAYKLYVKISEYMPVDIKIYFKKELVRLLLLRKSETSYTSNDIFFSNVEKIANKLNSNASTDLKTHALKIMMCEEIYKYLELMYDEEKEKIKVKHTKHNLCKMLANISKLANYAHISLGIITMDEISKDKSSAIISIKTLRLGIEMCRYILSTFNYIGDPEMVSPSSPNEPVRYVRRSYTLVLEPEDVKIISDMLEWFKEEQKNLFKKCDKYIFDEIKSNDEKLLKIKMKEENEKRAKIQQQNDWIEKNQTLLTKNEHECKICKLLSKIFLCVFVFFFLFSSFVLFVIKIPNSFLPIIALLFGIASIVYFLVSKHKTKNIKFYQNILEQSFNIKN